jgi:uncharacterized cupin superfamily protein
MTQPTVTRLEADGPADSGLQPCQFVDPSTVIEGTAIETAHNYFTDVTGKITAGVWECSAYTERMEGYAVDEYCYVLKGSLVITVDGEEPQTFTEGDAFMIQRGTKGIWHQPETFRKYYVIIEP